MRIKTRRAYLHGVRIRHFAPSCSHILLILSNLIYFDGFLPSLKKRREGEGGCNVQSMWSYDQTFWSFCSIILVIILLNLIYICIKWSLKIDSEEIAGSRKNYIARILVWSPNKHATIVISLANRLLVYWCEKLYYFQYLFIELY